MNDYVITVNPSPRDARIFTVKAKDDEEAFKLGMAKLERIKISA